jgi:hypothetical protein
VGNFIEEILSHFLGFRAHFEVQTRQVGPELVGTASYVESREDGRVLDS